MQTVITPNNNLKCFVGALLLAGLVLWFASSCSAAIIEAAPNDDGYSRTPFVFEHMGLGDVVDLSRSLAIPENDHHRVKDTLHAGYYYMPPQVQPDNDIDSLDIQFIKENAKRFLKAEYYDDDILDYIENYYIPWFDRKEFFFRFKSNGVPMRISGWYGKFLHIIIDVDFDSKESFVSKAFEYFNLKEIILSSINVAYDNRVLSDGQSEFFFFYDDKAENGLILNGYTILKIELPGTIEKVDKTVLDLSIYPREQKDEK